MHNLTQSRTDRITGSSSSAYGPEFVAKAARDGITAVSEKTAFIETGPPRENGSCESFNFKPRDELHNVEIFYGLAEVRIAIETWRRIYSTKCPHSSLGYRPPVREVIQWPPSPSGAAPPASPAVA